MDIAKCLTDKKSYDIAYFGNLESELLDKLRRNLVCKECTAKVAGAPRPTL